CVFIGLGSFGCSSDVGTLWPVMSEQRHLQIREPEQLPKTNALDMPPPATVSDPQPNNTERPVSLNDAIRITVATSKVVRVLVGTTAVSSGKTIYDAAITNTTIDQQKATFDPTLTVNNTFNRTEPPFAVLNPLDPTGTSILATRTDDYTLNAGLAQKLV